MFKRFAFWLGMMAATISALGAAQTTRLPDGEGRKILETSCASCHGLEKVTVQHNDRDVWNELIKMMRANGAKLDDKDVPVLLEYLVKNFGPDDDGLSRPRKQLPEGKGKPLVQRICTACHSLDRILITKGDEDLWTELLDQMISEGAEIEDDEYDTLLEYLATNFGRNGK
jgi:cytochrome c5